MSTMATVATMASSIGNYTRHGYGPNIMELHVPRFDSRRAESNLESDFSGTQVLNMSRNKGLRRISSTLDLFSGELRDFGRPLFHSTTEGDCVKVNSNTAASRMNEKSHDHVNSNNRIHPARIPCPPSVWFTNDGAVLREKPYMSIQQPISRPPVPPILSNSDPTATTSMLNNVKFPPTVNITENLWAIYEDELSKQPPRLRKEFTAPLPQVTTQEEWPPLRQQYALARTNRVWNNKEERNAILKKSFEGSLFPGGLGAFMQLNLQQRINADANGVQLCLASPLVSSPTDLSPVPGPSPPLMRAMSGKQLIENLQAYEHMAASSPRGLSHSSCSHNLRDYKDQDQQQQKIHVPSDPKPALQTHDADGRRRKGFRRGDDALQLAVSENWAVNIRKLNVPINFIPQFSRFFVIKSNCELDIFASLKYGIWTSTDLGNKRLDRAFRDTSRKGPIYLFFSVSGSGKFCGIAEMMSAVDLTAHAGIWSDRRWRGRFDIQWKIVKDVGNNDLRKFRVANNDHKPFTNCRDTQEILPDIGEHVFRLFSNYVGSSSLLRSVYPAPKYDNEEEHHL